MAIEMVTYFRGKRLEDMTREELIDAVNHMGGEAERWRNAYFEEAKGRGGVVVGAIGVLDQKTVGRWPV